MLWHESQGGLRILLGKPEVKGPLGTNRRHWEYNIKMNLKEVGYEDLRLHSRDS